MNGFLLGFGAIECFRYGLVLPRDNVALWLLALVMLAVAVLAYLLGSINSAVLVSRGLFGKDVREYGSKNAGLTNMHRVFGIKGAVFTLVGDVAKAVVSVLCGMLLCGYFYGGFTALLFCVIGHAFPCYFGFRGGKGILSAASAIACLSPATFCVVLGLFFVMVLTTRFISVGSITAAFFFPLTLSAFLSSSGAPIPFVPFAFALITAVLVIYLHRENVRRLIRGEEKKFGHHEPPKEENGGE